MKFFEQFTPEQIKRQYKANLEGLERMRDKAIATGKPVNGYSLEQLESLVIKYNKLANQ